MPLTILLALSLPLTRPTDCAQPVALGLESARRIATREIASRPTRRGRFALRIEQDPERPGHWLAYQRSINASMRGGGGLSMSIDRCTGAVSNVHYSR